MDLSDWIDRRSNFTPDKTAITFAQRDISYRELSVELHKLATVLAVDLKLKQGDRIAYLGHNSPELIALIFACARLGVMVLPLNWRLTGPDHVYQLNHATPTVLFTQPDFIDHINAIRDDIGPMELVAYEEGMPGWHSYEELLSRQQPEFSRTWTVSYEDPVLLCYTSGTTGKPKGAVLTQENLFWNAVNSTHMHDLTSNDVILTFLPMYHVAGINMQTLPALHAGARIVLHQCVDIDLIFDALERDGITLTVGVPTVFNSMLQHPRWDNVDLSTLTHAGTGSTIASEYSMRKACEQGMPLYQIYGTTETSPIAAYTTPEQTRHAPMAAGKTAIHCEIRVIDKDGEEVPVGEKGEILVRGPNVMKEYWNDPVATDAAFIDDWFCTGDIGHFDEQGFLFVDDRSKDMIISGGENIYPAAIENVLTECSDITEVAVVGRPDDYWGEVVVAVVVPQANVKVSIENIQEFCSGRIARYQQPRELLVVDKLPRNSMGKVVKEKVREMIVEPNIKH